MDVNGRKGEWGHHNCWDQAPEWPENFNEATGVGEFQAHARPMRVPSRGSAVSQVSRFSRNTVFITRRDSVRSPALEELISVISNQ
jgi:hypothetical protein